MQIELLREKAHATPLVLCAAILWIAWAQPAVGVPANPTPFKVRQADGVTVTLHVCGDEYFHWLEDEAGYTVVFDGTNYAYAELDPYGALVATRLLVGRDDPATARLTAHLLPAPEVRRATRALLMRAPESRNLPPCVPLSGTVANLVILCLFSDHTVAANGRPTSEYSVLFNAVGGDPSIAPTGSVRDYFTEGSYGQLTLNSTVVGWVTLPNSESYYANGGSGIGATAPNARDMVIDALNAVDPLVDFTQFDANSDGFIDAITIVHSGYAAEWNGDPNRIWSHYWWLPTPWTSQEGVQVPTYHTGPALWGTSGTAIGRIGVICHEFGHFTCLPDLYDTDYSSQGAGNWCLMASGSWGFDNSQYYPSHLSAWCKLFVGWVGATELTGGGTYAAGQVETSPQVCRIAANYPADEYLLIENRQPVGFDQNIPQGGLAIWHVDDQKGSITSFDVNDDEGYPGQAGWPQNGRHYRVALLQADGLYDLERNVNSGDGGDVYQGAGITCLDSTTVPNTDTYQRGNVNPTNVTIAQVGNSGPTVSFRYYGVPFANASWGSNEWGQSAVPAPNWGFAAVAGGGLHSLGLRTDGSIVAWGDNAYGQCNVPTPNEGFTAVAAGASHSLGLRADGSIAAWGANWYGQCDVPEPNGSFTAVAAGEGYSLGLRTNGSIAAWGLNGDGQCDVLAPNAGFVAIAAGGWHGLGLRADGSIAAWGGNWEGQCNVPAPNAGFTAVAAGLVHNLGLRSDGSIAAWGSNWYGKCDVPAPNAGFTAVAAGVDHSLSLRGNRSIAAWGSNGYGQCNVASPNTDFMAIAAGYYHSLGLRRATGPGDFNGDADLDLSEFALFQACFSGPGSPPGGACWVDADFDDNGDVDVADFAVFEACFNGPDQPACPPPPPPPPLPPCVP